MKEYTNTIGKLESGKTYVFKDEEAKRQWLSANTSNRELTNRYYLNGFTLSRVYNSGQGIVDYYIVIDINEIRFFKLKGHNDLTLDMLKTGMIVYVEDKNTNEIDMCMVLLNTDNGDILVGGSWEQLTELSLERIISVWQPCNNKAYLQTDMDRVCISSKERMKHVGLNVEGCKLVWKRKTEQELAKEKRMKELQDKAKTAKKILESIEKEMQELQND